MNLISQEKKQQANNIVLSSKNGIGRRTNPANYHVSIDIWINKGLYCMRTWSNDGGEKAKKQHANRTNKRM